MKVLIACEESQRVCTAFREKGHEAYSCDTQPCSGGHPEWHIQDDVLKHLNNGWDMMIAHPPCTYLAGCGAAWFDSPLYPDRRENQRKAIIFFMQFINAPIEKICVENPVGIMSTCCRKPNQIIQPYYFGDNAKKTTCLWLKNLPLLRFGQEVQMAFGEEIPPQSEIVEPDITTLKTGARFSTWDYKISMNHKERAKLRSITFPGIAKAMAEQWG